MKEVAHHITIDDGQNSVDANQQRDNYSNYCKERGLGSEQPHSTASASDAAAAVPEPDDTAAEAKTSTEGNRQNRRAIRTNPGLEKPPNGGEGESCPFDVDSGDVAMGSKEANPAAEYETAFDLFGDADEGSTAQRAEAAKTVPWKAKAQNNRSMGAGRNTRRERAEADTVLPTPTKLTGKRANPNVSPSDGSASKLAKGAGGKRLDVQLNLVEEEWKQFLDKLSKDERDDKGEPKHAIGSQDLEAAITSWGRRKGSLTAWINEKYEKDIEAISDIVKQAKLLQRVLHLAECSAASGMTYLQALTTAAQFEDVSKRLDDQFPDLVSVLPNRVLSARKKAACREAFANNESLKVIEILSFDNLNACTADKTQATALQREIWGSQVRYVLYEAEKRKADMATVKSDMNILLSGITTAKNDPKHPEKIDADVLEDMFHVGAVCNPEGANLGQLKAAINKVEARRDDVFRSFRVYDIAEKLLANSKAYHDATEGSVAEVAALKDKIPKVVQGALEASRLTNEESFSRLITLDKSIAELAPRVPAFLREFELQVVSMESLNTALEKALLARLSHSMKPYGTFLGKPHKSLWTGSGAGDRTKFNTSLTNICTLVQRELTSALSLTSTCAKGLHEQIKLSADVLNKLADAFLAALDLKNGSMCVHNPDMLAEALTSIENATAMEGKLCTLLRQDVLDKVSGDTMANRGSNIWIVICSTCGTHIDPATACPAHPPSPCAFFCLKVALENKKFI